MHRNMRILLLVNHDRALVRASGIGALSAVVGLAAARQWALAPGGTIVLVAAAAFVLAAVVSPTRHAAPAG